MYIYDETEGRKIGIQKVKERIDFCKTDSDKLFNITGYFDEITHFNSTHIRSSVEKPMEAVDIVRQFGLYTFGTEWEDEQPFNVQYIEDHGTWVVVGDIYEKRWWKKLYYKIKNIDEREFLFGGSLRVVIDEETASIVYMDHTV